MISDANPRPEGLIPSNGASSNTFTLTHPLGLRALPLLEDATLAKSATVHLDVTVLHVLECRGEVERWLGRPAVAKLALSLAGPLSFSGAALARLAPKITPAQVDAALALLLRWTKDAPERIAASFEGTFVGLTPWTTIPELREHLDGIRRHGLAVDPILRMSFEAADPLAREGLARKARDEGLLDGDNGSLPFRIGDERVRSVVASAHTNGSPSEAILWLEQALVSVGSLPRPRGRRLRLLGAPPEKGERRAHVREVDLTRECNLACGFCTSRGPEPRTARERAARAISAVRAAAGEGGTTLVLSGAEPTLEWYLDDLITLGRSLGFEEVVLETNAVTLAEPGRAADLKESGLTLARVALNSFDAAIADGISGVHGALEQTLEGVRRLLAEGVAVELAVALLPENAGELARVIETARSRFPDSEATIERVVARVIHSGPRLKAPLALRDAASALMDGVRASVRSGIPLVSAPGGELPPCVFDSVEEATSVLRLSEGVVKDVNAARLYTRIALCEACGAREVCPGPRRGLEVAVAAIARSVPMGAPGLPPTGERKRVLRELLSVVPSTGTDGTNNEQRVLRVNFHCNQACDFCFVSRELPAPEEALVLAEIAEAARRGAALALSGGEPTLNPRLLAYIARATELGVDKLELQTNAIKMSDAAYATALAAAGLKTAFVSLHGSTAATCDRVTAAPGTFVKTVEGIKNLLRAGVLTRLNFVVCGHNAADFAAWPAFVAQEFCSIPGAQVEINFSFAAAMTDNVPRDTALLPRFSDVAWALEAALDCADALGMTLLGFDSQCGVPACFLPPRVREAFFTQALPDGAIEDFSNAFRKGEACVGCALSARCYGVRTAYADMYGTAELRAVAPRQAAAAP